MAKSGSKYQTVLRVKRHQEKVTQQQLRRIQDEHERENTRLAALNNKKDEALDGMMHFGRAKVKDMQVQRAFIFKLDRQIDHQSKKVETIRKREVEKLDELTERAQSRQMVEKLERRKQEERARAQEKKEQALIDDAAARMKAIG